MNILAQSHSIADELINVRYKNGDASALIAKCKNWFSDAEKEMTVIRGSNFRVSQQLDLLDKANDRVRAVYLNCELIIGRK